MARAATKGAASAAGGWAGAQAGAAIGACVGGPVGAATRCRKTHRNLPATARRPAPIGPADTASDRPISQEAGLRIRCPCSCRAPWHGAPAARRVRLTASQTALTDGGRPPDNRGRSGRSRQRHDHRNVWS
ncbi:MAG: hypothetical protein DI576_11410 [Actinomyces sp.]|nr:MAG: hypothetical protein DI576_11410 [Actinomyces sp.]